MFTVGVANPTAMTNNASKFNQLPFDVCLVAETSATSFMQKSHSKTYKKTGLKIVWGHPSPSQRICLNDEGSRRGTACGVCILAKATTTIRPTRDPLPGHWDETCRLMVSYVQLPTMTIRLICVYGVQHCAPGALAKNRSLWLALSELLACSNLPTLVGGDFNMRPQSSEVWSDLQALGFSEVFEHHQRLYGDMLPHTCDQSTRNDTLLFSRHFADLYRTACVDQNHHFPRHDPLLVSLSRCMHTSLHPSFFSRSSHVVLPSCRICLLP